MVDQELKKFRTRWLRWLGQKTRIDRPSWVELLDCNWLGWVNDVLDRNDIHSALGITSSRRDVKNYYEIAIYEADMHDLIKLDNLYASDLICKTEERKM